MGSTYILGFTLYDLVWFFFLYSVVGWVVETVYESLRQGLLVNRGFLIGCYCPIYGFASWLVLFSLSRFRGRFFLVFLLGMVLATLLEYFVGWLMETTLQSKWWDYSHSKFNFKGRVSLLTSLAWGLMCAVVIEFIHPFTVSTIHSFSYRSGMVALGVIFITMSIDAIISLAAAIRLSNKMSALANIRERATVFILQHVPLEEGDKLRQRFLSSYIGEIFSAGYDRLKTAADSVGFFSALDSLKERYDQIMGSVSLSERRFFRAFPSLYFPKLRELSEEVRERAGRDD